MNAINWDNISGAVWRPYLNGFRPISQLDALPLDTLIGIDEHKATLLEHTRAFVSGKKVNHTLLWGSRGSGKSSLVKAVAQHFVPQGLRIVQLNKQDLAHLPEIMDTLRDTPYTFIIFFDDFSFADDDDDYKLLKIVMDGSIEAPPTNIVIYATSNRRHFVREYLSDNEGVSTPHLELHYSDAIEEKISLADRFGLWLSFYPITQAEYLDIVRHYFNDLPWNEDIENDALMFSRLRGGARSGRTAKQFYDSWIAQL